MAAEQFLAASGSSIGRDLKGLANANAQNGARSLYSLPVNDGKEQPLNAFNTKVPLESKHTGDSNQRSQYSLPTGSNGEMFVYGSYGPNDPIPTHRIDTLTPSSSVLGNTSKPTA